MLFYSNAQKTRLHIRAVLEVITDTRWSSESANVADRGVSVHTPIHPIFSTSRIYLQIDYRLSNLEDRDNW